MIKGCNELATAAMPPGKRWAATKSNDWNAAMFKKASTSILGQGRLGWKLRVTRISAKPAGRVRIAAVVSGKSAGNTSVESTKVLPQIRGVSAVSKVVIHKDGLDFMGISFVENPLLR